MTGGVYVSFCQCRALNPLCISVPLLAAGRDEGYQMVHNVFGKVPEPSLAAASPLAAAH